MWEGVTPVGRGYEPIVGESKMPLKALVFNAGPGTVLLKAWDQRTPSVGERPDASMELRPGATRAIVGALVRVALKPSSDGDQPSPQSSYAAVGWRVEPGPFGFMVAP